MGASQKFLIDLRVAMKSREATKVLVLRSLVAALKNGEIEKKSDLTQDEENKIIGKEAKKREDAILIYKKADRAELVEKEETELKIIKTYLPEKMSEEEVSKIVKGMKTAGELDSDFGKSMKLVMAKLQGKADGKVVSQMVREIL